MRYRVGVARFALLTLAVSAPLLGQPAGPEWRVNVTTGGNSDPSVAGGGAGGFVIAWGGFTTHSMILARRFDDAGTPLGDDFQVNVETAMSMQSHPSVARAADGSFLVAWGYSNSGVKTDILGRLYDPNGTPVGAQFLVNSYTTGYQRYHVAAAAPDGGFLVVWSGEGTEDTNGVYGRRFTAAGVPAGPDFPINDFTSFDQSRPSAAFDGNGEFLVAWSGIGTGFQGGVWARRYASDGAPATSAFRVNAQTTGNNIEVSVAGASGGGFLVLWQSAVFAMNDGTVYGQLYEGSGAPAGTQFRVNTYVPGYQLTPSAASDSAGSYFVVWRSDQQDGSEWGLYAQRLASDGTPIGGELRVNTFTTGSQQSARVASFGAGRFVAVWPSMQGGAYQNIYAQRFWAPRGDADGSGAVGVGDVFYLINTLFAGGAPPIGSGDADGNGVTNISDVFYLINYLFAAAPAPPA